MPYRKRSWVVRVAPTVMMVLLTLAVIGAVVVLFWPDQNLSNVAEQAS